MGVPVLTASPGDAEVPIIQGTLFFDTLVSNDRVSITVLKAKGTSVHAY